MAYYEIAQKVFAQESDALTGVAARLDDHFDQLIEMIRKTGGRLIFIGIGKSEIIAQKIAASLSSIGQPSFVIDAANAYHGDLGRVASDDLVFFVSNSGETQEVIRTFFALQAIHGEALTTVSLTGAPQSTLATNTTLAIDVGVDEEVDVTGLAPTASTTATLVFGDALLVVLEKVRQFDKENFAQFHPGGNIGRMLLQRVKHVMHTRLPYVTEDTPINEVIYRISDFGLGITMVRNGQTHAITGIVTDGDIRKKFLDVPQVKRSQASDYMTRGFISINQEERNQAAWQKMAAYSISNLIVEDNDHQVVGVVTIHDVLE
ncbi:KpsF/GutQ family sugar-phosphate isomerase [Schleiferilactobacillus harbinensis]|jgi:arabinose-5-phosphate isomerase|uniref:KpsF/GutQ family sugar-phosphate isomerase n=2 Tax=Schleiferilactobacillus harbinensis TaxID=304207 RepID=A0A510TT81_9LACO|nr:KpsF/GutQ family sugar-phosphate isomerase [Schleiferilactobacillus harbinensis]KRM29507.1 arabinose-5-phosphate isomerase [Schleiferilactobacillus harbinensis DSM 16991]MBO3090972.1 KpsF/GutQ family sugar-phosphate isomerase [Schleiferilactobacillus harbinensis]MCT2909199.1 KpsF/GutQ family sugar-phosphate isomerase [Schleiferilactobacillus harbinensis]QFR22347.1 KpsF/GutQ family sugar-phosphate isomerase [Schleiferilactobacillus harbinensis]QFR63912.1 KpsF/GutQ family sugar-phosphate isom